MFRFRLFLSAVLYFFIAPVLQAQGISGPQTICLGDLSNFTYTAPSGLSISSIGWTFGDGGTANNASPAHTYAAKGKYRIRVQVLLSNSSTVNDSMDTEVFGLPLAKFYMLPSSDTCYNNNLVCYRDTSLPAAGGQSIVSRLLVWGDGTFQTQSTPLRGDSICHRYPVSAAYNLYMEITDNKGCKSRATDRRNVVENITVDFRLVDSFVDCSTAQIILYNRSFGAGPSTSHYRWHIDTLQTDTGFYFSSPRRVYYSKSRSGTVTLIAYANNQCRDTMTIPFSVTVDPLPTEIILSDTLLCNSDPYVITCDATPAAMDSLCWYFDDGPPPIPPPGAIPKVFSWFWNTERRGIGIHEVKLKIFRGSCIHTITKNIRLQGPQAMVTRIETEQCFSQRKVFLIDTSRGVKRSNCRFRWNTDDPNGDNCTAWHNKGINLNKNCNTSKDHYFKHSFSDWSNSYTVGYRITDTLSGCSDSSTILVERVCSPILKPDTFHVCRDGFFKDNVNPPWPDSFSFNGGKRWLRFPTLMDSTYSGTYEVGFMFVKRVSPWAEDYGNDSFRLHFDTAYYYDTVFRKQKVIVHNGKDDSVWIKVYGKCRPFRVTVFFQKGQFEAKEKLRILWADHGNLDSTFSKPYSIDSVMHVYDRIGVSAEIQVYMENVFGCGAVKKFPLDLGKNLSQYTPKFINCHRDTICFYPFVFDIPKRGFWSANTPNNRVSWYFPGENKSSTDFKTCHRFNGAGMQAFQMIVNDSLGCTDTLFDTVFLQKPLAGLKKNGYTIFCSDLKQFFDSSSYIRLPSWRSGFPNYRDSIKSYAWRFGDGVYNTFQKNPLQSISTALDSIPASHVVQTISGCTDTIHFYIRAYGPKPYFWIRDSIGCNTLQASFVNLSRQSRHYLWQFGDSAGNSLMTSSKLDQSFLYTKPGRYYITLTGIDTVFNPFTNRMQPCYISFPDKLFQADTQRSVLVLPLLKTGISGPDTVCLNSPVAFVSNSDSAYNTAYDAERWFSSDGAALDTFAPSVFLHRYTQTGIYTLSLKPYYNDPIKNRCRDSASKTITVLGVKADFDVDPASKAPLFRFVNKSQPLPADMYWDFGRPGPGNNSTETDAQKDYGTDTGSYTVCLVASIPYGCRDTVCKVVFNDYLSGFGIYNVFSPGLKDNLNDVYDVVIEGESVYELRIFNRWGQQVYYSDKDYDNTQPAAEGNWNGKLNNEGPDCPAGTYYYIFRYELKSKPGEMQTVQGTIRLMR